MWRVEHRHAVIDAAPPGSAIHRHQSALEAADD